MNGYDKLQTLIICLDQLLASKIHKKIKFRKKITIKSAILLISIFLDREKVTPHYTFLDLAENILSDWLWAPLLMASD